MSVGTGTTVSLDEVQNKLEATAQQKKTNVPLGSERKNQSGCINIMEVFMNQETRNLR